MEKIKLIAIGSQEYPEGRWDKFVVKPVEELIEPMMNLFRDLGFNQEVIGSLDIYYPNWGGIMPLYGKKIKAYLIRDEKELVIIFDTSLPREDINKIVEKYFEFPK